MQKLFYKAGCRDDRRSTSGYVFMLGNSVVTWSKKQITIALSSIKADYRVATLVACQEMRLRRLLMEIGIKLHEVTTIYCYNMSSIQLVTNLVFHARTKHIEVHYHFTKEKHT